MSGGKKALVLMVVAATVFVLVILSSSSSGGAGDVEAVTSIVAASRASLPTQVVVVSEHETSQKANRPLPSSKTHQQPAGSPPMVPKVDSRSESSMAFWGTQQPFDPKKIFSPFSLDRNGAAQRHNQILSIPLPNVNYAQMLPAATLADVKDGATCETVEIDRKFLRLMPSTLAQCAGKTHQWLEFASDGSAKGNAMLCPQNETKITDDREWADWIRVTVGPVFLRLILESEKSLINAYCVYQAALCKYSCFFALPPDEKDTATEYVVKLRALHTDYWSVRETDHRTRHSFNKAVVIRTMPLKLSSGQDQRLRKSWPCWIARPAVEQPAVLDGPGRPLRLRQWKWSDEEAPSYRHIQQPDNVHQCLIDKKIRRMMVTGDSQARSVYWGLKDYLVRLDKRRREATMSGVAVGNADRVAGEDSGSKLSYELRGADGQKLKEASANNLLDTNLNLFYKWDSYLEKIEAHTEGADVVIAGFGSHPASWGQWTFRQYAREIVRIVKHLCLLKSKGVTVVWYGAPAWPKPKTVDNFRATNGRLGLFNAIALSAFQNSCRAEHRPDFVDFFELSHGLLKASKDSAHYDGSVVMPVLAQMILTKVCRS